MKTMIVTLEDQLGACIMNLNLATDLEFSVNEVQDNWIGTVYVQFEHYVREMKIRFDDNADAAEFQRTLLQYFREGSIPAETDKGEEYCFCFEFEAISIDYIG